MPMTASVKVMRSHDYCHFEVNLGADNIETLEQVDEMRKQAARLADKAVVQYRIAKANAQRLMSERQDREYDRQRIERIRATPEGERTVAQQAELKAWDDGNYHASRSYDYEDDWSDDSQW